MTEHNGHTAACDVASFAIGAAIGAGLMLLFAPKSGRETRDELAEKCGELKEKAQEVLDQALDMLRGRQAGTTAAEE